MRNKRNMAAILLVAIASFGAGYGLGLLAGGTPASKAVVSRHFIEQNRCFVCYIIGGTEILPGKEVPCTSSCYTEARIGWPLPESCSAD